MTNDDDLPDKLHGLDLDFTTDSQVSNLPDY